MGNRHNYSKHFSQETSEEVFETPEVESETIVEEEPKQNSMGSVAVDKLNLRSTPSSKENNIIKELVKDEIVEILEKNNDWYHVCTASGVEGYVVSDYIQISE